MQGGIGDTQGAYQSLVAQGKEGGGPGIRRENLREWEDTAKFCMSVHLCLEEKNNTPTNVLGDNNSDTKRGGEPGDWADGTNMEGTQESHGSSTGDNHTT